MDTMNYTQVRVFVFSGLTENRELAMFLFIFFLHVYMVTVVGNIFMMAIIRSSSHLQSPMYFFLSYLSLVDLIYSSSVTPTMLAGLISTRNTISFIGCAFQFFFFAALACTEVLLLANMSYDRYAAICHPLHYVSIMTKRKCFCMVVLSVSISFVQSSLQTSCVFTLQFCGSNTIDHFYCDLPQLSKLSCSDASSCVLVTVFFVVSCGMGSFIAILISYTFIISSILRIKSTRGRRKAFSTCSSHLMCSTIFYVSVFFTYFHTPSNAFEKQDKMAAVFYSAVTPMLNPLIYTMRNQEVKRVIIKSIHSFTDMKMLSFIGNRVGILLIMYK